MPYNITPSLGIDLNYVGAKPYYDANSTTPTPKIGSKVVGDDGHDYVFVSASGTIAAAASPGTQITVTEPAFTAATGAGGFYGPITGATAGQFFWARKLAL